MNRFKLMQPLSFSELQHASLHGNVIPIAASILADLITPVSAFISLCGDDKDGFLFESVEGGENVARYSFLGTSPKEMISYDGEQIVLTQNGKNEHIQQDIFTYIKKRFAKYRFVENENMPRFSGGLVGYFGYDTVRLIETLPAENSQKRDTPVALFGFYDTILAFDRLHHQIHIITNVFLEDGTDLRQSYNEALARIESIKEQLMQISPPEREAPANVHADVHSNFKKEHFHNAVRTAKDYIRDGDIFQVVLSQKFSRTINVPPIDIYRALRIINPSPYLYFVRHAGQNIIGSSPELMVRVENGTATVRPIAGTRPRGKNAKEDQELAMDLLADEKEVAEHVMLMDLGRNDIGRIAEYGTVEITENMIIERYSHVMHIVSEVRGKIKPGLDAIDVFKACFPAGTVSGAPKVRAMEIIEELEPERRGAYSGALGYIDFSGNLDTCIAIRTLEVRENVAHFQAGAGIVADSDPEREFQETVHKSNAVRSAIAVAEGNFKNL